MIVDYCHLLYLPTSLFKIQKYIKKLLFIFLLAFPFFASGQFVLLKADTMTSINSNDTLINEWRVDTTYAIVVYARHTTKIITDDTTFDKFEKKHYGFMHYQYPALFDTVFKDNHKVLLFKALKARVKSETDLY